LKTLTRQLGDLPTCHSFLFVIKTVNPPVCGEAGHPAFAKTDAVILKVQWKQKVIVERPGMKGPGD
jgi:hypothetical protein